MKSGGSVEFLPEVFADRVAGETFFIDSGHHFVALPLRGCIIAEPDRSKAPDTAIQLW